MKHFLIYTNYHKDKNLAMTGRIRDYLQQKGHKCTLWVKPEEITIPEDIDCMIALGGDGTMLQAVWDMQERTVPVIGVNLGTLGYMTEVEPAGLELALDKIMAGEYDIESRMMLQGTVVRAAEGAKTTPAADTSAETTAAAITQNALNDIVISRNGPIQVISLNIYVNGKFLNKYSADGVIMTTPTGSTGYNLSAGGPIVEPSARLIVLTPICPHTLNSRSIILSPEDKIEIEVAPGRDSKSQEVMAYFDGAHEVPMRTGDRIEICRSKKTTEMVTLNKVSFLEILHRKLSEKE